MGGEIILKCPECCNELEKMNYFFYHCLKCNSKFVIYCDKEIDMLNKLAVENIPYEKLEAMQRQLDEKGFEFQK